MDIGFCRLQIYPAWNWHGTGMVGETNDKKSLEDILIVVIHLLIYS